MEEKNEGSAVQPWNLAKIVETLREGLVRVLNPGPGHPMLLADVADNILGEYIGDDNSLRRRFGLRTVDTVDEAAAVAAGAWKEPWSMVVNEGGQVNERNHLTWPRLKTMALAILCIAGPPDPEDDEEILKRWKRAMALSVAERRSDPDFRDAVREFFDELLENARKQAEGDGRRRYW